VRHEYQNYPAHLHIDLLPETQGHGIGQEGISIGKDFLLVGFDDVEECRQVFPQLSSVKCDLKKFAEQVAITIINLLNNDTPPLDEFRQPVKLVARQSSRGA
jgi:LacI family transcriptional regulator